MNLLCATLDAILKNVCRREYTPSPQCSLIVLDKEQGLLENHMTCSECNLPAVQSAKKNWSVSKKKNMTRREKDAPTGRNTACAALIVWKPAGW